MFGAGAGWFRWLRLRSDLDGASLFHGLRGLMLSMLFCHLTASAS